MADRGDQQTLQRGGNSPKRIIAAAYKFAVGDGDMPQEIEMGRLIDRFGAQAVLGRPMGAKEIRRIMAAEYVLNAYRSMTSSENYAAWVNDHPQEAELLSQAAKLVTNGQ